MRIKLTFFFSYFLIGALVAFSNTVDIHKGDGDIEEIIVETINDEGHERGEGPFVQAYLSHATNTLSISFVSPIGSTTITMANTAGGIIYTDVVNTELLSYTQFPAPSSSGQYTLHIQSASFEGLGSFNILF